MKKEALKFHIQSNDYFGTIAAIVSLIRQNLENNENICIYSMKNIEKDLLYLQKNYKIVKK